MILGVIIGPVLGFIQPDAVIQIVPYFAAIALIVIMFDGGLNLDIKTMVRTAHFAVLIAILGFVLSMVTAGACLVPWRGTACKDGASRWRVRDSRYVEGPQDRHPLQVLLGRDPEANANLTVEEIEAISSILLDIETDLSSSKWPMSWLRIWPQECWL